MKKFNMLSEAIGATRLDEIGYADSSVWDNPVCGHYIMAQLQADIDAGNYTEFSIVRLDDVLNAAEFKFEMEEGRELSQAQLAAWYDWALSCPIKVFKLVNT